MRATIEIHPKSDDTADAMRRYIREAVAQYQGDD